MKTINVNVKEVLGTVTAEQIQALNPAAAEGLEKLLISSDGLTCPKKPRMAWWQR